MTLWNHHQLYSVKRPMGFLPVPSDILPFYVKSWDDCTQFSNSHTYYNFTSVFQFPSSLTANFTIYSLYSPLNGKKYCTYAALMFFIPSVPGSDLDFCGVYSRISVYPRDNKFTLGVHKHFLQEFFVGRIFFSALDANIICSQDALRHERYWREGTYFRQQYIFHHFPHKTLLNKYICFESKGTCILRYHVKVQFYQHIEVAIFGDSRHYEVFDGPLEHSGTVLPVISEEDKFVVASQTFQVVIATETFHNFNHTFSYSARQHMHNFETVNLTKVQILHFPQTHICTSKFYCLVKVVSWNMSQINVTLTGFASDGNIFTEDCSNGGLALYNLPNGKSLQLTAVECIKEYSGFLHKGKCHTSPFEKWQNYLNIHNLQNFTHSYPKRDDHKIFISNATSIFIVFFAYKYLGTMNVSVVLSVSPCVGVSVNVAQLGMAAGFLPLFSTVDHWGERIWTLFLQWEPPCYIIHLYRDGPCEKRKDTFLFMDEFFPDPKFCSLLIHPSSTESHGYTMTVSVEGMLLPGSLIEVRNVFSLQRHKRCKEGNTMSSVHWKRCFCKSKEFTTWRNNQTSRCLFSFDHSIESPIMSGKTGYKLFLCLLVPWCL